MDKWFHLTLNRACYCLSVLRLKLNHVNKKGPKLTIYIKQEIHGSFNWKGLSNLFAIMYMKCANVWPDITIRIKSVEQTDSNISIKSSQSPDRTLPATAYDLSVNATKSYQQNSHWYQCWRWFLKMILSWWPLCERHWLFIPTHGSNYRNHNIGTPLSCQVTAYHLEIGYPLMRFRHIRFCPNG